MPKAKPSLQGGVIVHRIEAGEWERQNILRPVANVAKVAKVASAVSMAAVCVGVGLAGYSAYWFLKVTSKWATVASDEYEERKGNVMRKWEASKPKSANLQAKWEASKPRFDNTSAAGKAWIWLTN